MNDAPDWAWWNDPENRSTILWHPQAGEGGLAIFENTNNEVALRQGDAMMDRDAVIIIPPLMLRAVVLRLIELVPELAEAPRALPLPLLPAPKPRVSIPTPVPAGGLFDREAAE
jgi:hypothetical protein